MMNNTSNKSFLYDFKISGISGVINDSKLGIFRPPANLGIGVVYFNESFLWEDFNHVSSSALFWLNCLGYIKPLLAEGYRTDETLELATQISYSWYKSNPISNPCSGAWDGHAIASRAEIFSALYVLGVNEDWLSELLILHADFLFNPDNHQGFWNHGLDQDIGLFYIGVALDNVVYVQKAINRIIENFSQSIDEDGLSNEQSTSYQFYVYLRYQKIFSIIERYNCNYIRNVNYKDKLNKMLLIVANSISVNGEWIPIGDTKPCELFQNDLRKSGVELSYSANMDFIIFAINSGSKGKMPLSNSLICKNGFIFARTGWGLNRLYVNESCYSVKFGKGRIVHGHNDHTSVIYDFYGHKAIIEGGFHGYHSDKMRGYLRSPDAHNVVTVVGNDRFNWNEFTHLVWKEINDKWQSYQFEDIPYHNVTRKRSLLVCHEPEMIIILDSIQSRVTKKYKQTWHIDKNYVVAEIGNDSVSFVKSDKKIVVQQLWPIDDIEIVAGQINPFFAGWASYEINYVEPVPTVISYKSGKFVTFLTIISFVGSADNLQVSQKKLVDDNFSRVLQINLNSTQTSVYIDNQNNLQIK